MVQRVILIALGLLAQVLGLPADQSDPTQWGTIGIATGIIWGTVELLRRTIFKDLDGIAVNVLAGVTGIAFAVALGVAEVLTGSVFDWVVFGVQATFFATVLDLGLKKAGGNSGKAVPAP